MTRRPRWLRADVVLAVQELLLREHGGAAGVRDLGLLDSALARPKHLLAYSRKSLFELAAAYASAFVRNHPFVDGNKRVAFVAAYVFLRDNGWELVADEAEVVVHVLGLADKSLTERRFAAWLKARCIPLGAPRRRLR